MSSIAHLESLSGLSAFVATVDAGGFAAAGRRLGMSASAIGKAVGRMEDRLGIRLLIRTTRRVSMTFEGEQVYARATRLLDDLRDMEGELASQRGAPKGRVRISLPATLGRMLIVPRLGMFAQAFPEIELEIGLDDRKVDLIEGGYDLAIRTGHLEDSALLARSLGSHRFVLCASPAYLSARVAPQGVADLATHTCIRFRYPSTGLLEKWSFDGAEFDKELGQGPVLNDGEAVAVAAIAGLGLAQLPVYAAATALADGRLQQVMSAARCIRGELWLVRPASRAEVPRVKAVSAFLEECLRNE